jgi:hypothetical protein
LLNVRRGRIVVLLDAKGGRKAEADDGDEDESEFHVDY